MTGAAKNTIVKLLVDLGQACVEYQDAALVNLPCKRIECDENWSCYAKQKNVPDEHVGTFGSDIVYATLIKLYGAPGGEGDNRRYSPAECTGIRKEKITGNPVRSLVSTSYVERQNLTMRDGDCAASRG